MKKTTCFSALVLITIGIFGSLQGDDYAQSNGENVYVHSENIQFIGESIYVWDGYEWIQVSAIFSDGISLYYQRYITDPTPAIEHWDCPFCEAYNFLESTSCYNCGWPW